MKQLDESDMLMLSGMINRLLKKMIADTAKPTP